MDKIRLLYITYNENILESGILHGQVRRMLEYMAKRQDVEYIRLVSFISPRLWWQRRKGYERLVRQMADAGIDFRVQWMFAAQKWLWFAIPLIVGFCLPMTAIHLMKERFDVVHTRGYAAGLLGFISTRIVKVKFVFDPRGPYPEEMVGNRLWSKTGLTYRIWKAIEHLLICRGDAVVGVTPTFQEEFVRRGAKNTIFVPNRCDIDRFTPAANVDMTLLFTGEMDSEWYNPRQIAKHFLRLKEIVPKLKLKLITRISPDFVRRELNLAGVSEDDWTLEASLPEEMPKRMASAGLGLIFAIRWPVKFAEYLAAGVPLVMVQGEKHLTELVIKQHLGIVVDEDNPSSYQAVTELIQHRSEYADRCIRYARSNLDLTQTAAQYVELYQQLTDV